MINILDKLILGLTLYRRTAKRKLDDFLGLLAVQKREKIILENSARLLHLHHLYVRTLDTESGNVAVVQFASASLPI